MSNIIDCSKYGKVYLLYFYLDISSNCVIFIADAVLHCKPDHSVHGHFLPHNFRQEVQGTLVIYSTVNIITKT
jgi:hypothetical protein